MAGAQHLWLQTPTEENNVLHQLTQNHNNMTRTTEKCKSFSLKTYKYHSLWDYAAHI